MVHSITPQTDASKAKPILGFSNYRWSLEDSWAFGILLVTLGLVYYIRSQFLEIPFERDEGAYAYYEIGRAHV